MLIVEIPGFVEVDKDKADAKSHILSDVYLS